MSRNLDPLPADVLQAIQRGDTVEAVRRLRQHTGLGAQQALAALRKAAPDAGPPTLEELFARLRRAVSAPGTAPPTADHAAAASQRDPRLAPGEVPHESNMVWLVVALLLIAWVVWQIAIQS